MWRYNNLNEPSTLYPDPEKPPLIHTPIDSFAFQVTRNMRFQKVSCIPDWTKMKEALDSVKKNGSISISKEDRKYNAKKQLKEFVVEMPKKKSPSRKNHKLTGDNSQDDNEMVPDEVILEQMQPPLIPKVMLEPLGQTKKPRRRDCRNSESSDKSELGRRDYVKEMSKRLNKKNYIILDGEKEDLNFPEDDNFDNDYENFEAVEMDGDVIVNGNSDRKAPESRDLRESGEEGEMKKKKKKKGTKKENDDVEQDEEQIEDARNNLIPSKKRKNMGIVEGLEVEEEKKKKRKKKEKRDAMGYDYSTLQNTQE
ncbi:hypothetical protein QAD02_014920, partial [Eretmocerus hayati]